MILSLMVITLGCSKNPEVASGADYSSRGSQSAQDSVMSGQIYLYGEVHSDERITNKEIELWHTYYHDKGMRHMFIEYSYYLAEYLNQWMHEDSDTILEQLYDDVEGTVSHSEVMLAFFRKIKKDYPETIFHGVDVGHQYSTTGKRYLRDLLDRGYDESSEKYLRAKECIEQGQKYYGKDGYDHEYRENAMAQNFIREYQAIAGTDIMGIFGTAHVDSQFALPSDRVPMIMANQLKNTYGDSLHTENLALVHEPLSVDTIRVNGKDYQAPYFGKFDLPLKDNKYRKFWRLENAYNDFKDYSKTGDVLPYNNYPMKIEVGNVYVIEYTKVDGTVRTVYHRSDGDTWNNMTVTSEMQIPNE